MSLTTGRLIAVVLGCTLATAHAEVGKDGKPAKPAKLATPLTAGEMQPSDHRAKGAQPAHGAKPSELEHKKTPTNVKPKSPPQTK